MIIGDGSYVVTLEKRGYVKAGDWTPEAAVEVRTNQIAETACFSDWWKVS